MAEATATASVASRSSTTQEDAEEEPTTCTAVTSSDDGEVIVWDLLKGKVVRKMGVALHDNETPWATNIVVVDKATILTASGGEGFPQVFSTTGRQVPS